jgi:hypothetical protein
MKKLSKKLKIADTENKLLKTIILGDNILHMNQKLPKSRYLLE